MSQGRDAVGEAAARAALARLRGPSVAANATVTTLHGGINRRSYLVRSGESRWVLQVPIPGAAGLLDAATEAAVMGAASAAGIAPSVVASDIENGVLLTEYRASAVWSPEDARAESNVVRIAALLRTLHAVDVDVRPYRAETFARDYLAALSAAAGNGRGSTALRLGKWADEVLELARRYDAQHPPSVLCHNDLVAANVLDDGDLALIDFEYAVRGAPVLDLAGLAGMNDYGDYACRILLNAYDGETRTPISLADLSDAVRMVRLIAYFWARMSELRVADASPYSALAASLEQRLR